MSGGPLAGEHARGLGAALQVLGARLAEPAQVDHALHALVVRHAGERRGALALALGEALVAAAAAHRVDEVVGHVHAVPGALAGWTASSTSPSWSSKPGGLRGPPPAPRSRTRQRTSCPRSASERASPPPTKPVAPLTSARMSGAPRAGKWCAHGKGYAPDRSRGHAPRLRARPTLRSMKAGLCDSCRHQRVVRNTRGSVFSMCERAKFDERFPEVPAAPGGALPGLRAGPAGPLVDDDGLAVGAYARVVGLLGDRAGEAFPRPASLLRRRPSPCR